MSGKFSSDVELFPSIIGVITGGFLARLGLELAERPWPWPLVVTVGALLMGAGALIAWRVSNVTRGKESGTLAPSFWPLLLLVVYLVWPERQPAVAMRLLVLVGLAAVLDWTRSRSSDGCLASANLSRLRLTSPEWLTGERVADLLTFSLSLFLYILTTARDVLPADSGEFQIVAPLLGVAHPPGYPLYTLAGRLFTWLIPLGTAAYRLNVMSAFLGAGTLTLLGAATRRWARHLWASPAAALAGGLATALTLGTATTFWSQATVSNIRMPTVFFAAIGFYALARYAGAVDNAGADRALGVLALAMSLGVAHHPSLLFLGSFFLVYLIWVDPRLLMQPRRWWKPVFIALVALLPFIYLPVRGTADAPLAPPDLGTWDGFIHHITAQGFEGDMFAFANAQDLPQRLMLLPTLFLFQFNPALLAAAALGLLLLVRRDLRLLMLLLGGLVLHTFVSITYRAPQTIEYLMPAYLPLAILVGVATAWLLASRVLQVAPRIALTRRLAPFRVSLAAGILLAGLVNGLDHGPSYYSLAHDRWTRTAMESILSQAPSEALILADWHWATPLWYLQWVEGYRPDVEVRYVFPVPGQEYGDTWADRIEAAIGERPLLLTHAYDLPGYTLEPLGQGFWIHQRPHLAAPTGLAPLDAVFFKGEEQGKVRLLGYRLSRGQANPGGTLELTLAWQAVGTLKTPPSFVVALTTDDGQRITQADRYLGSGYTPGEIRFERLVLPLYLSTSPGDYELSAQVYSTGEAGFETWSLQAGEGLSMANETTLSLATLPLYPSSKPPVTLHPLDVPFLDGPTLVGVDYDRTVPSALRIYLHWRGPAQGGEQVQVGEGTVQLPTLSENAYHTLALDLPGELKGRPGLTLAGTDGQLKSIAGPWGWPLRKLHLPVPAHSARFVPLDDQMALIGVSPASGTNVALDDQLLVRLTFLSLKPLVNDIGISVRLVDEAGQLRQMHDLQPALGALPTLKWIRGSRITDPHPLSLPPDIIGGVVRGTLVVYERFRGTPLPPLDGRIADVPLEEWVISDR